MPPKPGGRMIAEKHFLNFHRATPTTGENSYKNNRIPTSVFRELNNAWARRKERQFWQHEFGPRRGMGEASVQLPEFFHSFSEDGGFQ